MTRYTCKLYENGEEIKRHTELIPLPGHWIIPPTYSEWFYSIGLDALKPKGREVRHFIDGKQVYVDGTLIK